MNFTLLNLNQISSESGLDCIMKEYGRKAAQTDLALLLGGLSDAHTDDFRTIEGERSCPYVTKTSSYGGVVMCTNDGKITTGDPTSRMHPVRPVLPSEEVYKISPRTKKTLRFCDIVEYGEYPQTVVGEAVSDVLDKLFTLSSIRTTGKQYTFDMVDVSDNCRLFEPITLPEYEVDGEKFIRIVARPCHYDVKLSNGKYVQKGKIYWVRVQPIEWLLDPSGVMVAKKCLFAGIQFSTASKYKCDFSETFMKWYLDNYFSKEIKTADRMAGRTASGYDEDCDDEDIYDEDCDDEEELFDRMLDEMESATRIDEFKSAIRRMARGTASGYSEEPRPADRMTGRTASGYRKQPGKPVRQNQQSARQNQQSDRQKKYGISVSDEPMSVKEQISFYVQNGMSFMLHGPSGVGKSQRVKEIDPNLTSITLCNGILPEDVIGKTIYPNGVGADAASGGVWVSPKWYTDLCKKCKTEPDKQHVLFIDEVTNARETTQSMIYHVALEKSIAQGVGKLPQNAVVVLAGNSKEESGAAYNMPAPLFRRLSHIYLELNIQDWLEWGSEHSKSHPEDSERLNIHPLIASFVAANGKKVFYSEYDEEDPPKYALDPRKWEKVSDKIYANKGVVRREILESDIGTELAANLLAYAKNPPLTLEDVVNGSYTDGDIPRTPDACLALTLSLRYATPQQVGTVRAFIQDYLGAENRAIFDSVWIGKDDARAVQIAGLSRLLKEQKGR